MGSSVRTRPTSQTVGRDPAESANEGDLVGGEAHDAAGGDRTGDRRGEGEQEEKRRDRSRREPGSRCSPAPIRAGPPRVPVFVALVAVVCARASRAVMVWFVESVGLPGVAAHRSSFASHDVLACRPACHCRCLGALVEDPVYAFSWVVLAGIKD